MDAKKSYKKSGDKISSYPPIAMNYPTIWTTTKSERQASPQLNHGKIQLLEKEQGRTVS